MKTHFRKQTAQPAPMTQKGHRKVALQETDEQHSGLGKSSWHMDIAEILLPTPEPTALTDELLV